MTRKWFVKKEQTRFTMGPVTLITYLRVNYIMKDSEKAFSFMINKLSIGSTNLTTRVKNKLFSDLTESTAFSNVIGSHLPLFAQEYVKNINSLTVISYHNNNVKKIKNCVKTVKARTVNTQKQLKDYKNVDVSN